MKKIELTQNKWAIVDDEDSDRLNQYKWYYDKGYAARWSGLKDKRRTREYLHRVINQTPAGLLTDHINRDTLDNRKSNLRTCDSSQNQYNRVLQSNNTSGHKGIIWENRPAHGGGYWRVYLYRRKRQMCVGYFRKLSDAIEAYKVASKELYQEFGDY